MRALISALLLCLFAVHASALDFSVDDPVANKKMNFETFDSITKLLYAGHLAPHMKCDIKVRTVREERTFTDGKRIVELLDVEYYPRGIFVDLKIHFQIPAEFSTYGVKYVSTEWSGTGEDIKIEAHDRRLHWIQFMHDGKGNIVQLSLGNDLATYPCRITD